MVACVGIFFIFLLSADIYAETPDKYIFETRLTRFIQAADSDEPSEVEVEIALEELVQFATDYPNSEFISDSQIIPYLVLFFGASSEGNKKAALFVIDKIEAIVSKYPEGKLNDFTVQKFREFFGVESSGAVFIPYKYLPTYMLGTLAMDTRHMQDVVDNFSSLRKKLDFEEDAYGVLTYEIYAQLLIALKLLGETDEFNIVAQEASEKFPDNIQLMETIKRLQDAKQ